MRWFARQRLALVLALASLWPLGLLAYGLWSLAAVWIEGGRLVAFQVHVENWAAVFAVLFGVPLAIVALWALARRVRPPEGPTSPGAASSERTG